MLSNAPENDFPTGDKVVKPYHREVERLIASIDQPDKFAQIFCDAALKQKSIDNILKQTMADLLKQDVEAREIIKHLIREVEKEDWRYFMKKIGFAGWTFIIIILTGIIQGILGKFFK